MSNLNAMRIETDGEPEPLRDYSVSVPDGSISVYFKNLEDHLIQHIQEASLVVGCVAWLTNKRILDALAEVPGVAIVVQKEDFLRPDINARSGWRDDLRRRYDSLRTGPSRYHHAGLLDGMSVAGDPSIEPVRCVGNYNNGHDAAFPRMHHKFLVFCKGSSPRSRYGIPYVRPYAVWTGSFNLTENATMSFENAVVMTQPKVVAAYYHEWQQVEALSEPLDWTAEWSAPTWRIGT